MYLNTSASKLLQTGELTTTIPTSSFYYAYNADSGSKVTFLFSAASASSLSTGVRVYSNSPSSGGGNIVLVIGGTTYTLTPGTSKIFCSGGDFSSLTIYPSTSFASFTEDQTLYCTGTPTELFFTGKIYKPPSISSITWNWYDSNNTFQSATITDGTQIQLNGVKSMPGIYQYVSASTTYNQNTAFWGPQNTTSPFFLLYFNYDSIILQ
jgi:hypothetical protein